jgi:sugar/nucleoside kinase (ribokinase family)
MIMAHGAVTLDVIIDDMDDTNPPRLSAGGTCGNVLAILSYLGWSTMSLTTLRDDLAAKAICGDFAKWGVDTRFITRDNRGSCPIAVHNFSRPLAGKILHSYLRECPSCGRSLPTFLRLPRSSEALRAIPKVQCFFTDTASPAGIRLAKKIRSRGGVVVFEPCGITSKSAFAEMVGCSHIIKYSQDELSFWENRPAKSRPLELETMAASGLRFRCALPNYATDGWQRISAYEVARVVDSSGCGDWLTAGIINKLCYRAEAGFLGITEEELIDSLLFGQALAAWNCRFAGPRTGMYEVSQMQFHSAIAAIQGRRKVQLARDRISEAAAKTLASFCPSCNAEDSEGYQD